MPKSQTVFSCQNCGAQSPKWLGKCPDCGKWNTFAEESFQKTETATRYADPSFVTLSSEARPITEVTSESVARGPDPVDEHSVHADPHPHPAPG